jgi:hypothetical protein
MILSHSFAAPVGIAALLLSAYAPFAKERRAMPVLAAANLTWLIYMLIFDALTAAASCAIATVGFVAAHIGRDASRRKKDRALKTFLGANVISLVLTWQGLHSLIAFVAGCVGTYSTFRLSYDRLRIGIATCLFFWGLNSLYLHAWEGVASTALQLVCQLACVQRSRRERISAGTQSPSLPVAR